MPKATTEQGQPYFFEEGEFLAILRSVEERHVDFIYKSHHKAVIKGKAKAGDKSSFDNWEWEFELLEGDREGQTITLTTDPKVELEGYSPARVAYEALQGEALELGQEIDTDLVVGCKARVVLKHEDPKPSGDRTYYNTVIADVLPAHDSQVDGDAMDTDEPPF